MPGGLDGGALGFLCFGWATEVVAVVAAWGITYFFGGMAAKPDGEWEGRNGERKGDWREEWREWEGSGGKAG